MGILLVTLFWLLPLTALALAAYALRSGQWKWGLAGLILYSPPLLYLSATPRFDWATGPLLLYGLAILCARFRKPNLGRTFLSLAALLTGLLAVLIYLIPPA